MEIMNMDIITDPMTSDRADLGSRGNLLIPDQVGGGFSPGPKAYGKNPGLLRPLGQDQARSNAVSVVS
jgi:hypothetical protein